MLLGTRDARLRKRGATPRPAGFASAMSERDRAASRGRAAPARGIARALLDEKNIVDSIHAAERRPAVPHHGVSGSSSGAHHPRIQPDTTLTISPSDRAKWWRPLHNQRCKRASGRARPLLLLPVIASRVHSTAAAVFWWALGRRGTCCGRSRLDKAHRLWRARGRQNHSARFLRGRLLWL